MQLTALTEEKLLEDAKEPGARQVRIDLTVDALSRAAHLDASDEEVEAEYTRLAEQDGMELGMVKKYLAVDAVKDQLVSQKAVAVVVDNAVVVKPEKKTTKKTSKKSENEAEAEKDAE